MTVTVDCAQIRDSDIWLHIDLIQLTHCSPTERFNIGIELKIWKTRTNRRLDNAEKLIKKTTEFSLSQLGPTGKCE